MTISERIKLKKVHLLREQSAKIKNEISKKFDYDIKILEEMEYRIYETLVKFKNEVENENNRNEI